MSKKSLKLRSFVTIGMLSSISFVLMLLNFPLPWFPVFLQIDFSDIPALIAAITMGPVAGILVELMKNVLDWIFTGAPEGIPVGHIANFVTGISFVIPAYYIYKKFPSVKGLIGGLVISTFIMSLGMAVLNYFAFLPMYTYLLGMPEFNMYETIILGILPFNIVKGIILLVIATMVYRTMRVWIENQRAQFLA
ncbi:MAG: ECF transporter S component [Solibacillus sp.]